MQSRELAVEELYREYAKTEILAELASGRRLLAIPHPSFILRQDGEQREGWVKASVEALKLALAPA